MKQKLLAILLACCLTAVPVCAEDLEQRVADLEEKVSILEQKMSAFEKMFLSSGGAPTSSHSEKTPVFYLTGQSGSTENGDAIIIYSNGDPRNMESIGFETKNFDGSLLTYIYIDDVLTDKEQCRDMYSSIYITGDALAFGEHTVTFKQYADNDESGEVLFEQSETYEVIEK